jgi:hypothetical protein
MTILFKRLPIVMSLVLLALFLSKTAPFAFAQGPSQTTRVSVASDGSEGNGDSYDSAISGDGRYVAFLSWASNLVPGDTNGATDIFVHDRQTGQTTRVSIASDGAQGNYHSISLPSLAMVAMSLFCL